MMRFLLFIQLFIAYSFAIVDIASVDFGEKDEGLSGSIYGSFEKKRGNTDKDEAEYGGRIQLDTNKTITWLQGSVERDRARGYLTDDNAFIHLRHIHQIFNPAWAMEVYFQLKQDKFQNLKTRTLIGTGPRYRILDSSTYGKVFLGLSVMDETIKYNEFDPDEHNYRMSSYFSYKMAVNKTFDLSFIGYYQPKIDNASDYRVSGFTEMTIHLTKVFDLSYLIELDYDAQPSSDSTTTDTRQRLAFIYRFGQGNPLSAYAKNMLSSSESLEDHNNSSIVAVELESKISEIDKPSDTFAGGWMGKGEKFSISLDGNGYYSDEDSIYAEKISWKIISTETTEGVQAAKDQHTKLVIIRFIDEEGRPGRVENYLWSENTLVGLSGSSVKMFRR